MKFIMNEVKIMEEVKEIKCDKGCISPEEISEKFDSDDICMKCPNTIYKDGVISCKYQRVN